MSGKCKDRKCFILDLSQKQKLLVKEPYQVWQGKLKNFKLIVRKLEKFSRGTQFILIDMTDLGWRVLLMKDTYLESANHFIPMAGKIRIKTAFRNEGD